jgi:predicted lipoprotein with Yx(FWY)xxD motif
MTTTKKLLSLAVLSTLLMAANSYAMKPCEELKTEIAAKLDKSGVKTYTLNIVANDKVGDAKVMGSCENGSKKITYTRP